MSWLSDAVSNNRGAVGVIGAIGGGLLGAPLGPGGILAGAAAGGMLGQQVEGIVAGGDQNAANKDAEDTAWKRNVQGETIAYERNQASAREQMAFQERMSSTAHQREVADLKAAGINPIMAAGGSGSATTGGAAASASAATARAPRMEDTQGQKLSQGLALVSALQSAQMQKEQIQNLRSQTDKNNIDTAVRRKDLPEAEAKYGAWSWLKSKFNEATEVNAAGRRQQHLNPARTIRLRSGK